MFKRFLVCATLLASVQLCADPAPQTIRVLLLEKANEVHLEVTGRHKIYNASNGEYLTSGFFSRKSEVLPIGSGIAWGEEFPQVFQITVRPTGSKASCVVNGVQFDGIVHIYQIGNQLSVVNEIPVEEYCKVVFSSRIKEQHPSEVMAALAIATRTHAYYHATRKRTGFWDVKAEEVGYQGAGAGFGGFAAAKALENTRNMVMEERRGLGGVFPAVWTEDCAGKTAPFHMMFRKHAGPDGQGVEVPSAMLKREASKWTVTVPKEWLARLADLEDVTAVSLYADSFSEKVYAMRIFNGETARDVEFSELQKVVGAAKLVSTDFTVEMDGDQVLFTGYGKGHGVGICLLTADEMAAKGKNAAQILEIFYPEAPVRIAGESVEEGGIMARQQPRRRLAASHGVR